jgi:hypothetical protein
VFVGVEGGAVGDVEVGFVVVCVGYGAARPPAAPDYDVHLNK